MSVIAWILVGTILGFLVIVMLIYGFMWIKARQYAKKNNLDMKGNPIEKE